MDDYSVRRFRGRVVPNLPAEVDVRSVRLRLGMTQNLFAARFGFSLAALRHWEHGDRKPRGPSLTLLNVIARQPHAVLRALRAPPLKRVRQSRYRWTWW